MTLAQDLQTLEQMIQRRECNNPLALIQEIRTRLAHFARRFGTEDDLGVTVKLEDGRTIYWPADDLSRLAPSVVCGMLRRIQDLRGLISRMEAEGQQVDSLLRHLSGPIPYEDLWLSGNVEKVHNALLATGLSHPDEPKAIHAPFEQVIRRGLMAGLKLGEACKLNPTAYVRELNEALELLNQYESTEDSPFIQEIARLQSPNKRHEIGADLVREQTRCKVEELIEARRKAVESAHHNRLDYQEHPERWAEEPSTTDEIHQIYDEFIRREQLVYSTVRVIERPDGDKRFILVYGDEDDATVIHGTGPFESYESARAWYLTGGR